MNRSLTSTMSVFSLALLAMTAACSKESEVSLGVPRDKTLSSLSAEERTTACKNAIAAIQASDDELRGACTYTALRGDATASSCESGLEACVTETRTALEQVKTDADCEDEAATATTALARCAGTVAQWEDCFGTVRGKARDYYTALSCASTLPEASPPSVQTEPACAPLREVCPDLVGSD